MTSTWYMVTVKKSCVLRWSLLATMVLSVILTSIAGTSTPVLSSSQLSLDGPGWRLATDPKNVGRDQRWFAAPRTEALPTQVPWIIQDAFPGYHGVAWYWREFLAPANPHADGRYLLRCWAVDYQAEVWVNGLAVGSHEGGETPFLLDVTDAIKPNTTNLVAVRVINPSNEPIDGMVLRETPARNKAIPYGGGSSYNHGGLVDSVELILAPAVRVDDLFVRPDPKTGIVRVQVILRNSSKHPVDVDLQLTAAPAASGETLVSQRLTRQLPLGDTLVEAQLLIAQPHLWDLNDPYLYRVTARVAQENSASIDEHSVRCGFRDFRFEDGCFRLNGRRIFLRCSHTGNHCPIGLQLPPDPDFLRRDLLNVKVMGFNAIRFIAGVPTRSQLDFCDEIGLMVYEESYAGWCLADSPQMTKRFDQSVSEMIRRDRNHPSLVMWGLLNETGDGPVFRHAVATLPWVRTLDDSRVVMLNSGRFDIAARSELAGLQVWRSPGGSDPNVTHNSAAKELSAPWASWPPGQLALHPGPAAEASAVRWTAPGTGEYEVSASFDGLGNQPTTDVHILHGEQQIFGSWLNLNGGSNSAAYAGKLLVAKGDTIDFVVGSGNGSHGGDTTGLRAILRDPQGTAYTAAGDFLDSANPAGPWSYGFFPPGSKPDSTRFSRYSNCETMGRATNAIGSLSNPGSAVWEDVLSDQHPYQRAPHTAEIIRTLRTLGGAPQPVFVSEYGIGSAVDLVRVVRQYEQWGKPNLEDARFYRDKLEKFLVDWNRWQMDAVFGRPEDFFMASLRKMAGQRLLGLNALRANPNLIGHSLTGTVDQGMSGEGLFTTFRELKPGTIDALFDAWAPLRWCLFVEPVNLYRGARVRLEAVLANEDVLASGSYFALLQVFAPDNKVVWKTRIPVNIRERGTKPEAAFSQVVLGEDAVLDGPPGKYRFVASFEEGAAAAGGETEFYVAERPQAVSLPTEVVQWGEDTSLAKWLDDQGFRHRPFVPEQTVPEVILASAKPPTPGGAQAFELLLQHVARGSTVVFLAPEVFKKGDQPLGWLPLARKGTLKGLMGWLYHKDEWARNHPIFAGLPTGMLDYTYYREIIPDLVFADQDAPTETVCAANNASIDYSSGFMVAVYPLGQGRFVLNSLHIRELLGTHPVADQLLRNLLHFASVGRDRPLADLPKDFDSQLKTFGYE